MSIPAGFWKVTIGNILAVIFPLLTVVYYGGKVTAKIDDLSDWKKAFEGRIDRNEISIRDNAQRILLDDQRNVEQDRRITSMEVTLQQVVPDVREIKTKLDLVAKYLEESRPGNKPVTR